MEFQYIEYTADKEKVLKHDGAIYRLSPYALVWDNDKYYVFGWSERHGKIVKFRVDRMLHTKESFADFHRRPEDYDIEAFCKQVFLMYDGEQSTVQLLCENDMMGTIVDRFGDDVRTYRTDGQHFIAEVEVSVSSTFFSWLFAYDGAISIVSPQDILSKYKTKVSETLKRIK